MKKILTVLALASLTLQAGSFTITKEVKVSSSEAIYKTITKRTPYQECWDEEVPVQRYQGNNNNGYPIGTIIGGVAGGVIGHQVGRGRGNDLATVGGAIIGSIVGHNISNNNQRRDSYTTYETKKRCSTRYEEHQEDKFMGYKNMANYKGRKIVKVSDRRLRYIPITITVRY